MSNDISGNLWEDNAQYCLLKRLSRWHVFQENVCDLINLKLKLSPYTGYPVFTAFSPNRIGEYDSYYRIYCSTNCSTNWCSVLGKRPNPPITGGG